jgi:hypothetical protein
MRGKIPASFRILIASMVFAAAALSAQEPPGAPVPRVGPKNYGTNDYTVTTVSAIGFYPETNVGGVSTSPDYYTSGSKGRYGDPGAVTEFYAPLDLPGGAVIDFIGLNTATDVPFAFSAQLYARASDGTLTSLASVLSTAHGWATDWNPGPLGAVWSGQEGQALLINVEQASNPNLEFFGWVEVWWKRSVSPAPFTATFTDVPPVDPGFQYIEALVAAGITGGCGGGQYCPNNPVTRRQMAVFLAKALGLHWPGVHNP